MTGTEMKQALREHIARLKKELPAKDRVVFYFRPIRGGSRGLCYFSGKSWIIWIDPEQSKTEAMDTLAHEWAHVLDGEAEPGWRKPHRDSWGKWHAKAFRVVFQTD